VRKNDTPGVIQTVEKLRPALLLLRVFGCVPYEYAVPRTAKGYLAVPVFEQPVVFTYKNDTPGCHFVVGEQF